METKYVVVLVLVILVLLAAMGITKFWQMGPIPVFFVGLLAGRYWWPYCKWHNKG